jgi:hypothetical protein
LSPGVVRTAYCCYDDGADPDQRPCPKGGNGKIKMQKISKDSKNAAALKCEHRIPKQKIRGRSAPPATVLP